ncbi:hypothetical protein LX15_000496 [Streptoalloteichus tenebrarius]|uniref:DUF3592 domain-containing protein n=1 Tax=Streptoalloteichus tenebrarius (strain ATCC 17920 / DSM 40477 / JCM 4838 / CBS 697.72 / NBRC 16177 / NCIMB 11028 / NRRL B-12390 / A12253. 1 / ISP 5477) TaxID=1933 RepID=A0ABT1HMU3_STRSD|nr:hypothetical protein [Streptoalloteichus tenebrarius]MCP2256813.1 hypothetical protein [Streptoalloteichus tenebrarius]BFF00279.1 hypothetical protein GCM10020241_19540 [Streptoalloteichus tenebrarius]
MALAERRWPVFPVLLVGVALLVVCSEVAHWRLRDHGVRVTVTIVESSCEPGRARCAPHYRVRRPDGSELGRPLSPPAGARHAPGDWVEVLEDPDGVLAPQRVSDIRDDAGRRPPWWRWRWSPPCPKSPVVGVCSPSARGGGDQGVTSCAYCARCGRATSAASRG